MHAVPRTALLAIAWIASSAAVCACAGARREAPLDGRVAAPVSPVSPVSPPELADAAAPVAPDAAPPDGGAPHAVAEGTARVELGGEGSDDDDPAPEDYQAAQVDPSAGTRPHAPVLELSDAELAAAVKRDLASLGAISIGRTNAGALVNGVVLPESPYWERVSAGASWATTETRDYLTAALAVVHAKFPGSPKVYLGNVSLPHGGAFPPHVSHQSGRDVDISYFLASGHTWYAAATAANLDLARTWAFVRALVTETDVEMIFIDRRIQPLLRAYAVGIGEDRAWVDSIFQYNGTGAGAHPLVLHVRGHATHIHVRFRSPVAEELGRRAYAYLLRRGVVRPPTYFAKHVVKKGETLSHLALRYKTPIDVLRKTNGLTRDVLREGREYRIPRKGGVVASGGPVLISPRRLPPHGTDPVTAHPEGRQATR